MFKNLANQSLFTLNLPSQPDLQFKLQSLNYHEALSQSDTAKFHLITSDDLPPSLLHNQLCDLSWDWEGEPQFFHGKILGLTLKPSGLSGTEIVLTSQSAVSILKSVQQSRHFIYKNLQTIVREVIEGHGPIFNAIHFHLNLEDPERDYTEQHNESDFSFIERILHEAGWFYRIEHLHPGVDFHVYDESNLCPVISQTIRYQPLDQGTKSVESIFELSHHQDARQQIVAKSDCLGLRAGQVFLLSGHPLKHLNQHYLIVSVKHEVNEQNQGLRYQNHLILLPTTVKFKPSYIEPERRVNTLGIGYIHSESDAPHLTDKGEYLFRSPHTDELSHPVRLATPYSGSDYGFHFPLHNETQVLVAYLNGHPDQPVLLGSLFNDEQPNPVNSENARQNLWITESGHTLLMDDHPGAQKILLHTAEQTQRLLLDASNDLEKIELISETGDFHADISQGTEFQTQADLSINAGQSIDMIAEKDCMLTSEKSSIQSEAALDLTHHAGQNMKLVAEQDYTLRVDGQSQTTVTGNMRTDLKSGSYQLKVASGNLEHQTQANAQYTSLSGNIVLKTANASVSLNSDGTMVFNAKKIVLQADVIDIHNAGQGANN